MFNRQRRTLIPELMDTEHVDRADLADCLRDLETLSRLTGGHHPTLRWLQRVTQFLPKDKPLEIIDIACGGGDMLRAVAQWGQTCGRDLRLIGIDLNPDTVAIARARTPSGMPIEYRVGDALAATNTSADLIMNALFLHHLDDAQAADLLRWMQHHARLGWLISDLHRHALSYWGLRIITPALRMHRFVRHDGPASVARGWSRAELLALTRQAGLSPDRFQLRWALPFRWVLSGQTG